MGQIMSWMLDPFNDLEGWMAGEAKVPVLVSDCT